MGRIQDPLDGDRKRFVAMPAHVAQKLIAFIQCRRETCQVEGNPTQPAIGSRFWRRRQPLPFEPREDERIDSLSAPGRVGDRRNRLSLWGDK